ncbi:Cu-binding protein [Batrachochytrium dendrobatidis]|nr:Cu-binding protein [Batrachochytrium dendrobatidis]KAK5670610.1 Cu-binding protein [Batrachochytrium dendrobatidis]
MFKSIVQSTLFRSQQSVTCAALPAKPLPSLCRFSTLSRTACISKPSTLLWTTRVRFMIPDRVSSIRSLSTLDTPTKAPKVETTPEDMKRMTKKSVVFFLISGVVLLAYFYYEQQQAKAEQEAKKSEGVGKPKVGGPFSLVDQTGRPVTDLDYRGKYMLLYFGYTFCPDVCPEELEKMAEIVDFLNGMEGYSQETIVPIFVSCDPKRDSVESIREYLQDFHPKFIGLTGTYNQIRRIAKAYRLYFSAPPQAVDEDETDYLVDHSIFFYLVGPDGVYISHFGKNETAEEVTLKIIDHIKQGRTTRDLFSKN